MGFLVSKKMIDIVESPRWNGNLFINHPQGNPLIHYPLLLTAMKNPGLSNHWIYTDYSHVLAIDQVANSNLSTRNVKSTTFDQILYAN